ncbi:EamA-like transporter family [Solimicrobium silvestre]|uniref:EamA-like transporter family n=2 Tax=Solimicrobium silvestre TaxID=2099400 RepID=A0A2S9GUT3_9BURK|nr:EamA-like transporter family [Solimicrobium silvestre]
MNRIYLRLIGATFLWATVFHVGKFALAEFSPLAIATWRYSIAAIILLAMTLPAIRSNWQQIKSHWPILFILALLGVVGFALFIFYGLRLTSPVNASLIMAFNPALIIVLSSLFNREPVSRQQISGLLLGLCGVLIVVSHASLNALINLSFSKGDLLVGVASLCWAAYCVLPKRYASSIPSAQLSAVTIITAAILMLVMAGFSASDMPQLPRTGMLFVLLFLGLFGTVIPYLWWNQGVQKIGPAKAGVFMNLVPIFASLIGVVLGQQLQASQLAGASLVIIGVLITSIKFNKAGNKVMNKNDQHKLAAFK